MDYDDLIYSLLADRMSLLLKHRRGTIGHIVDLLESHPARSAAEVARVEGAHHAGRSPAAGAGGGDKKCQATALVNNLVADLNVLGLNTVLDAAKVTGRQSVERANPTRSRGVKTG
jgi:hypothetical protein